VVLHHDHHDVADLGQGVDAGRTARERPVAGFEMVVGPTPLAPASERTLPSPIEAPVPASPAAALT